MIYIANKKQKVENLWKKYPNAEILDVTSTSPYRGLQILSPFFPHRNIPIPFSNGMTATCVEAVWQGLKVFEYSDVDCGTFNNDTMRNIKRSIRRFGKPLGHRKGVHGKELLNYFDARMQIYIPTYKWILENVAEVRHTVEWIKEQSQTKDIVLLDYNTNDDFRDTTKPLSHAGLIKLYIEGKYPNENENYQPYTKEEIKIKKETKEYPICRKQDIENAIFALKKEKPKSFIKYQISIEKSLAEMDTEKDKSFFYLLEKINNVGKRTDVYKFLKKKWNNIISPYLF